LVLISRGWISAADSSDRPPVHLPPEGIQQIRGQVHVTEFEPALADVVDTDWRVRLARMYEEEAGRLRGEPDYLFVLLLESEQPGVLQRHWSAPRLQTRSHLAYAVQWFGIALVVALAALFYSSNLARLINARD